jgi:hypoxanthine phosphoribosyltransferase
LEQTGFRGVVTFSPTTFNEACSRLLEMVRRQGEPDIVVGIRTGGLHVAHAMAAALPAGAPILAVTCCRPSTRSKQRMPLLRPVLRHLPRIASDTLRLLEHHLVTARRKPDLSRPMQLDQVELMALAAEIAVRPDATRLLLVDDAVDSGLTLRRVLEAVRGLAPSHMQVISAAITVTTPTPAAMPDHALYHGTLCRFPWSLDAVLV